MKSLTPSRRTPLRISCASSGLRSGKANSMAKAAQAVRRKSRASEPDRGGLIPRKRRPIVAALSLVLVTLALYIPSFRNGFIWDDDSFLYENHLIVSSSGLW